MHDKRAGNKKLLEKRGGEYDSWKWVADIWLVSIGSKHRCKNTDRHNTKVSSLLYISIAYYMQKGG